MAKHKSIIPIVGTIGGINFYFLDGKPIARKAGGGFNGEAIKKSPTMVRVRENGSEFGHCSRVNRIFRKAIIPFYERFRMPNFHQRLMTLFTNLKKLDLINERGKRTVGEGLQTLEGKKMLQTIGLTPECSLESILPFHFDIDWTTYTLNYEDFDPINIPFLKGATHVRLLFGVLDFDFGSLDYQLHLSDEIMIGKHDSPSHLQLKPKTNPQEKGTLLAVLSAVYSQNINQESYDFNSENAFGMKILGVK